MRIELQWAFTEEDMREGPCAICEVEFVPRAVIIRADPHSEETCEECLRMLSGRKEKYPRAPWPTWEEYRALVKSYPEPMFATAEEMSASERASEHFVTGEWPAYDASWLWRVPEEDEVLITPTIIHRAYKRSDDEIIHGAATVEHEDGRALIVFRSEEEAEKYRAATGNYPEKEGFGTTAIDLEELGHVLEVHDCTHVAMPEAWTGGAGGVDFFKAVDFIGMLEESLPA